VLRRVIGGEGVVDVGEESLSYACPEANLRDQSASDKTLINELLPDELKPLFKDGLNWSLHAVGKGKKGHSNNTLTQVQAKRSWETEGGEDLNVETNGERLVWVELGSKARIHNQDNSSNVIAGGITGLDEKQKPKEKAAVINQALALGFARAKQKR
jgi:hypothetical protein